MKPQTSPASTTALLALAIACASASSAYAASIVWDGSEGNGLWTDGENWVGGVAPESNDFRDDAIFGATATPATVTIPAGRDVGGIEFQTAGWSLGAIDFIKRLSSTGAGVSSNTLAGINEPRADATWTVTGADHTLNVTGTLRYFNTDITLAGGGTLFASNALVDADFGSPTFTVNDGTLRIGANRPHASTADNGIIRIGSASGFLELLTSDESAVQAMFGSEIVDTTGMGLQTTFNSGTGYTRVSVVPEPSAALLGILGLAGFVLRRKR